MPKITVASNQDWKYCAFYCHLVYHILLNALEQTAQHNFSEQAKAHLYHLAHSKLPNAVAQIIIDTKSPFMQKVFDVRVEKLVSKRALLLGDASIILRPHVGGGASLAMQDAISLSEQLHKCDNIDQAIAQWEQATLPNRLTTFALSHRMADALVLNPISWQGMDDAKMDAWWEQIIRNEKWYTTKNDFAKPN